MSMIPECFQPHFMQLALAAVLISAPAYAMAGVAVVNRKMSFFSEAISHSAFTGIALGLILGIGDPVLVMVGFCLLVGLGIAMLSAKSSLAIDTVIGVFFALSVSLGIVIISSIQGLSRQLPAFLFGDILTVDAFEISKLAILTAITVVVTALSFNTLGLSAISREMAVTKRKPVAVYEYIFAALIALVVATGIRVIGVLLITAMLIVPAAAGRNVARTAAGHLWWSMIVAVVSSVCGLAISFYYNAPAGASVVLVASVLFAATYAMGLARR